MSALVASCPSCAGQVEFRSGSAIVVVCPFCRSAVARTDRGLADLGKVAELSASESPLKLGLKGVYNGQSFELTGRAQLKHEMGGVWDEWYATFSNGWVGWLAEAQGRFYLTFFQPLKEGTQLPSYEDLKPGVTVSGIPAKSAFLVAEKGVATAAAADGEIPYRFEPGEQGRYADISGPENMFGTIDYSMSPPWVFIGRQVTLDEIGLSAAKPKTAEPKAVAAASLKCPNCAGPLNLTAPDKAERVACPFCDSLLDVNDGALSFLKALDRTNKPQFLIPIGSMGKFRDDVSFKVIGATVRSVTVEGEKYFWHEYLLYNPMIGFRWLVCSDDHWNFVEPVNPGDVSVTGIGPICTAQYNGRKFKIFQDAHATVEYVTGEFYWRVEQGEKVRATDFISPPMMLSCEVGDDEMNWSAGTYLTPADVGRIFGISDVPKPVTVGANQPFTGGFYIKAGLLLVAVLLAVSIVLLPFTGDETIILSEKVVLDPPPGPNVPQTVFTSEFEIKANRNVQVVATADVSDSWADLDVDLVNEQSQDVESVNIPIEYYSGVDSDGTWTEGSRTQDASLSSLPAGTYTLRVEGTWEKFTTPIPIDIRVKQGVVRGVNFICAFLVIALLPAVGIVRWFFFTSQRMSQSSVSETSGKHISALDLSVS